MGVAERMTRAEPYPAWDSLTPTDRSTLEVLWTNGPLKIVAGQIDPIIARGWAERTDDWCYLTTRGVAFLLHAGFGEERPTPWTRPG